MVNITNTKHRGACPRCEHLDEHDVIEQKLDGTIVLRCSRCRGKFGGTPGDLDTWADVIAGQAHEPQTTTDADADGLNWFKVRRDENGRVTVEQTPPPPSPTEKAR